jgi:SAM-dependent methyltransferase
MDWTAGYVSDVEYTAGFYTEQAPGLLNFACILNGVEPVDTSKSFNYCELGFGRGLTVNVLAAANPQGRFYAADFNPSHVAGARQLAVSAELANLFLLESSFEQLAKGEVEDLPQFDFITLHGIYTWVTAENRAHIVQFISRYLKPGGIVYLSYNAMPGWACVQPLQKLLVEHAALNPNRSDVQIHQAAQFVDKLQQLNAGFITANPGLKPRLATLNTADRHYLVHEYMHRHWQPMYHIDVANDLTEAKLDYVGSADLPLAYRQMYLSAEQVALLESISDRRMRETVHDYLLNIGFRKDIFVRGTRRMSNVRQSEYLSQLGLALLVPRENFQMTFKLNVGEMHGKHETYAPLLDALAQGPQSFTALNALFGGGARISPSLIEAASLLIASSQVAVFTLEKALSQVSSASALNNQLLDRIRFADDYQVLASHLTGSGVATTFIERLMLFVLQQHPNGELLELAEAAFTVMQAQGRNMVKDGKRLELKQDNIGALAEQFALLQQGKLAIWQQLGCIPNKLISPTLQ